MHPQAVAGRDTPEYLYIIIGLDTGETRSFRLRLRFKAWHICCYDAKGNAINS